MLTMSKYMSIRVIIISQLHYQHVKRVLTNISQLEANLFTVNISHSMVFIVKPQTTKGDVARTVGHK